MSQINTAHEDREESIEKPTSSKKNGSVDGLIKLAVERKFGVSVDPRMLNEFYTDRPAIVQAVNVEIQSLKYDDPDAYSHLEDSAITDEKIIERILVHSKGLVLLREKGLRAILDANSELKSETESVKSKLSFLNEKTLQGLVTRKRLLRNFIESNFSTFVGSTKLERRDFEKVFGDIHDRVRPGSDEERRCLEIIQNQKKYGQKPGSDDIEFLLDVYSSASNERKTKLFHDLGAQVSISFAVDHRLINDAKLGEIAKRLYGDIYDDLPEESRKKLIIGLKQSQIEVLPVEDLNERVLGQVMQNRNSRKRLAEDISRSIIVDMEEENDQKRKNGKTIIEEIREEELERINKKQEETGNIDIKEEKYDLYEKYIDKLDKLRRPDGKPLIQNIHNLYKEGSVLRFVHPVYGTQFLRVRKVRDENNNPLEVNNGEDLGIELEGIPLVDGVLRQSQVFTLSYDQFLDALKNLGEATVVSGDDFDKSITTDSADGAISEGKKIYDAREVESDPIDASNIAQKINLIDPNGSKYGFEEGTAFTAPSIEEKTGKANNNEIWTIRRISGNTVDLMTEDGYIVRGIDLSRVYEVFESEGSKRITKISTKNGDEEFLTALREKGLNHNAEIKDGQIVIEETDSHGHGKEVKINCYTSSKGGHIRIFGIRDGIVEFAEFDAGGNELDKIKKHAAKNGYDKEIQKLYKKKKALSYTAFLSYLEKNNLEKTESDPILPDGDHGHDDHGHYDAHMSGSLLKRIMKWQNPASIMKGFEMLYHAVEHTLEKGAKLDAARFAMATAKMVGAGETAIGAQVYADITTASKEIVEKYEQKIFGLPGPAGRLKCIHIAHDRDSRPEEVVAAMNYMLKSYGQLYSEDIKHYQSVVNQTSIKTAQPGYFAFLDGFILTAKLGDLKYWRQKAYERAITEMGTLENHEGEPTEEQIIHALMKQIDGKWNHFPYAASVVKAIGGPGGYEKNWKLEGFDNAKKKGIEQTQMVNADGRVNKAVGYLKTHELYKAIGAMEAVAGKSKAPEHQVIPFIWCVGGFSQYASHHALQKIKTYAENGYTFHAFSFMRNKVDNDTYVNTVRLALKELGERKGKGYALVEEFDNIRAELVFDHNDAEKTEKAGMKLAKFWKTWQGEGLHDMLQGHNGWLIKKNNDGNSTARVYLKTMSAKHQMQLNDSNIPNNELGKDWFDEHGIRMNRVMTFDESTGLFSLKRMLNKINLYGTKTGDKIMKTVEYEKLWDGVKEQMVAIKDPEYFGGDLELQKRQFQQYRKEILEFFVTQLTARSITPPLSHQNIIDYISLPHKYLDDLRNMGIDPYEIYSEERENANSITDYNQWKSGISSGSIVSKKEVPQIKELIQSQSQSIVGNHPRATKQDVNSWVDTDKRYSHMGGSNIGDAGDGKFYSDIGSDRKGEKGKYKGKYKGKVDDILDTMDEAQE